MLFPRTRKAGSVGWAARGWRVWLVIAACAASLGVVGVAAAGSAAVATGGRPCRCLRSRTTGSCRLALRHRAKPNAPRWDGAASPPSPCRIPTTSVRCTPQGTRGRASRSRSSTRSGTRTWRPIFRTSTIRWACRTCAASREPRAVTGSRLSSTSTGTARRRLRRRRPTAGTGLQNRNLWALESSLDVEWAHAIAPQANIINVTTNPAETLGVQGFPAMMDAEQYVVDHHEATVITQSFGAAEESFG